MLYRFIYLVFGVLLHCSVCFAQYEVQHLQEIAGHFIHVTEEKSTQVNSIISTRVVKPDSELDYLFSMKNTVPGESVEYLPNVSSSTSGLSVTYIPLKEYVAINSIGYSDGYPNTLVLGLDLLTKEHDSVYSMLIQSTIKKVDIALNKSNIHQNEDSSFLFLGSLDYLTTVQLKPSGERKSWNKYFKLKLRQIHSYQHNDGNVSLIGWCDEDISSSPNIHGQWQKNDLLKITLDKSGRIINEEFLFNTLSTKSRYKFFQLESGFMVCQEYTNNEHPELELWSFGENGKLLNKNRLQIRQNEQIELVKVLPTKEILLIASKNSSKTENYSSTFYHFNSSSVLKSKKYLFEIPAQKPVYLGLFNDNILFISHDQLNSTFQCYYILEKDKMALNSSKIITDKTEERLAEKPFNSELLHNLTTQKVDNPNAVAVIIGNTKYKYATEVSYAENDAKAMFEYFHNYFGIPKENIIMVKNASKTDLETVFGSGTNHKGKLYNYVREGLSDVFVFYSGHGAPGLETKAGYFVPVDCDPNYVEIGGYSLDLFYQNLSKIPSISTTVLLDACFSGASIFRNVSPITVQVKNTEVLQNAVVITSSSDIEVSGWYNEKSHGLFTYYLLNGLKNKTADLDNDGVIRLDELNAYLTNQQSGIPYMARRLHGIKQTPAIFSKDMNRIFYSFK